MKPFNSIRLAYIEEIEKDFKYPDEYIFDKNSNPNDVVDAVSRLYGQEVQLTIGSSFNKKAIFLDRYTEGYTIIGRDTPIHHFMNGLPYTDFPIIVQDYFGSKDRCQTTDLMPYQPDQVLVVNIANKTIYKGPPK